MNVPDYIEKGKSNMGLGSSLYSLFITKLLDIKTKSATLLT
uniref:Uncharacterized protein n=1 Tax=Virgibacillus oceani TaxID=1479511 RepID=A0A917H8Z8_9BACI|nr:hypothetical protein GCM10011398_15230 [Virgibacillus oceani]